MGERKRKLDRQLDRAEEKLPEAGAEWSQWLRQPGMRAVRILAGVLLVIGGLLSFLPVLGIWMLPLGLALIAIDVPFLREPMTRLVAWSLDKWEAWRDRSGAGERG